MTQPDIAFVVNQLCQHMHNPSSLHWTATKRVLRYLKGTIDHGLWYTKGHLSLQAFCDSDWAEDPDDRRSTTSIGIFMGSCLVSWMEKKQPIVARSSTEAEYCAMLIATANLFGYTSYPKKSTFHYFLHPSYGVIILVLLLYLIILCTMLEQNISR
jgi:hypothetical protein